MTSARIAIPEQGIHLTRSPLFGYDTPDIPLWVALLIMAALVLAWYLSYTASRLDRLHARVEAAAQALEAQLARRAEVALEFAGSGLLDPASALILADAADRALEAETSPLPERLRYEESLTQALTLVLDREALAQLRAREPERAVLADRMVEASRRVALARHFHNAAVADVQRVRRKPVVRAARLAGHTPWFETIEFDDRVPAVD